jgi:hypothetical protein
VILNSTRVIDIKNLLDIFIPWGLTGNRRENRSFFEIDEICSDKRGKLKDFELTFHPEIINNIIYAMAPRDKVLRDPSTIVY